MIERGDEMARGGRAARSVILKMRDGGRVPGLAMFLPGPGTYTGETMLEVLVPGSPALLAMLTREVLALCDEQGQALVRPAIAGEFSARALAHGRVGIEQLEGIAMLIAASSEQEHQAGVRLVQGEIGRLIAASSERLVRVIALLEAGIDFSDQEDVTPIGADELDAELAELERELGVMSDQGRPWSQSQAREGAVPAVMLAGWPNAGKSTLLNALTARDAEGMKERSLTSPIAGTTRDLLSAMMTIETEHGAIQAELIDAPGVEEVGQGEPAGEVLALEGLIRERTLRAMGEADLLVVCSPMGVFEDVARVVSEHVPASVPRVYVRTKADRPVARVVDQGAMRIEPDVEVCALTGQGLGELKELIARRVAPRRGSIWPERLVRGFEEARQQISEARRLLVAASRAGSPRRTQAGRKQLPSMEVLAHHLRQAHDSLAQLSGPLHADVILGRIFSSFCIGK